MIPKAADAITLDYARMSSGPHPTIQAPNYFRRCRSSTVVVGKRPHGVWTRLGPAS